jgi:hypothetical protein
MGHPVARLEMGGILPEGVRMIREKYYADIAAIIAGNP